MADEPDTGELPAIDSDDLSTMVEEDPALVQLGILAELQSIRYRLGVLVVWFVALPIIAALIVWFAVSISNG